MKHLLLICAILALAACGGESTGSTSTGESAQAAIDLPLLDSKPAEPKTISTIKTSAKVGDKVVVQGRIGGRKDPFVNGRAAMVIADGLAINACDTGADAHCPAPWDFCCVPADKIATASIMVQVNDAQGKPLTVGLSGQGGLKPGAFVVVTGTLVDAAGATAIAADGIFVDTARKPEAPRS